MFTLYLVTISLISYLSLVQYIFFKSATYQYILIRVFLVAEFNLLAYYYLGRLHWKHRKMLIWIGSALYTLYSLIDFIITPLGQFDFFSLVMESLFFLVILLLFFYEKMKYSLKEPVYFSSEFWFSVAFLVYFSGNFFLFLVTQSNINNQQFVINYNLMYGFFTFLKNIILGVGIYTHMRRSEDQPSRYHSRIDTKINLDYVR